MTTQHPQEKIIERHDFSGITVEIVEWTETIWWGKIGYAQNNTDEPDVDKIMGGFQKLDFAAVDNGRLEPDWDVCMSANYLSSERPNGVMFGFLGASEQAPGGFDVVKVPAARYMRIRMCDETARALGHEPFRGGIPPHEWIGEDIAPKLHYKYGSDALPIFEYYGYYDHKKHAHEFTYLYVPVEKI